ncbi:TniQ family protein [Flavonifractor sp. An10]|mgnify:CR=1 FL=1|uniref:TniQ family protein n=1 Tax=Flavonifractor sp. An10 TaxID=1965537 RepID=UPI000B39B40D|nr:TniQ family protein [Flavonifractor sp. An10]OUQ83837.1 hypothetical protein B5E42_04010 [Flavonifractor sp. An10]
MIPFFPAPYPDELWYGIITRFHLQSGFAYWSDTLQMLFPGCKRPNVGSLLPNETMRQLTHRLPDGVLNLAELALHHSLLPFRLLFLPEKQKEEYLRRYLAGEDIQPRLLSLTKKLREHPLRYCPLCAQADREHYGESYWHIEHQIWIMPLCPVHGCRLMEAPYRDTMSLSRQLVLIPEENPKPNLGSSETEHGLTDLLHQWYQMPFDVTASIEDTDNLGRAIENAGLLAPGNVRRLAWDTARIYTVLTNKFGAAMIEDVFGRQITVAHARRLRLGEIAYTEEYALLSVLLGMGPEALFTKEQVPLHIYQKMLELSTRGRPYTKRNVAKLLGIRVDQVMPYAERFGIEPFWVQSGKQTEPEKRQTYAVTIHLSEEERRHLDAYMSEHEMDAYGHALRYFMQKELALFHGKTNDSSCVFSGNVI